MKSQILLLSSSQYRTIQVSILHNSGYSKFPLIPLNSSTLGSSTETYPIKTYMPIQNVSRKISHLHHRNSSKKYCSRERSTQYRPSCNGNESNQHIAGERSEFSAEIAEGSVVEIVESKENVSNDKGKNVSEEGHAENLSVYTAKYEDFEESSVHGFNFVEKWQSMWQQMKEIAMFAGPALGIWLCGPLMSLIDTAVIGQSSSLELAALGPGTVVCDNLSYVFMFLPVATSNIVATSLARKDEVETQRQLSRLLFVALACGIGMLLFTKAFGTQALHAFVGSKNASLVPAANTYVQIRGLAWPAVLVGMVAQSASLGMKDSWGPLKVLFVASLLNGFGDIILCSFRGYGIAGAAWATTFSQIVAALMMLGSVNKKGYNAFALSVPSSKDLIQIVQLAAPVFISLIIRVAFFSIITYFVTSMGPDMLAAHQVMIGVFSMCTIFGEPLSQTAQSFMPTLIHGVNRNLKKARSLLQSLVAIGAVTGFTLGCIGTLIAWVFPHIFTRDTAIISQMHQVIVPFFIGLIVSPPRSSLEGSLLAGRDMNFLSYATTCCFCIGCLLLLIYSKRGLSLQSCWWIFACFQWARFSFFYKRLTSFSGPLYDRNT